MTPSDFRETLAERDRRVFDLRIAVAPPYPLRLAAPEVGVSPEYVRRLEIAIRAQMTGRGVDMAPARPPLPPAPGVGATFTEQVLGWLPHVTPTAAEVAAREVRRAQAHQHPPAHGISLAELAVRLGSRRQTLVEDLVGGPRSPRIAYAYRIATALDRVLVLWPVPAPPEAPPLPAVAPLRMQVLQERTGQGMSQAWLAERAGLVQPWLCRVERGSVGGRIAHLLPLATALEVPLYLFPGQGLPALPVQ